MKLFLSRIKHLLVLCCAKKIILALVLQMGIFSSGLVAIESPAKLINISTRGKVGSEPGQELIAGFVIEGDSTKYILVRGVGPYLTNEGLAEEVLLEDPYLMLEHLSFIQSHNWHA
ncbi:hypothetical protein MLD52_19650 [Puniceicoccaceae bacterium K14]|nr:hypothetical protein [Puniceicoccaceae bacterium K14]